MMKRSSSPFAVASVVLLAAVGAGAWWWYARPIAPPEPPAPFPAAAQAPTAPPSAAVPAIRYPIDASLAASAPGAPPDISAALVDLFGRKAVRSMFQLDDFPRRFVATVDNLARAHAPSAVWPLNRAPGQFTVAMQGGASVIASDNGLRYTPYVLLAETVDMRRAAATYVRLYPLFQQAYQELGYPKAYFNDRLVEVIDHLLATPEPENAPAVHLPQIAGPVKPERPWVLYEFDDPALQSLSAGQKLLLRMGTVNERRMKAKLSEFRALVTARG
jgi:hypothetical protein